MVRETVATGASKVCLDCMQKIQPGVYQSSAGWYVGSYCGCGPYSRESGYYSKRVKAAEAYESGLYGR
jgi:hypothetical protein